MREYLVFGINANNIINIASQKDIQKFTLTKGSKIANHLYM